MYGNNPTQQGGATVGTATPEKQRSLRWLWITLGALAGLLVVGGGAGAFALAQYNAPAGAASQFCTDLKTQDYNSAYTILSAKLKAAYNSDQFHQANGALDAAEGKVTACGAASGSGSYDYSLGGSTATVTAVVTRDKQGNLNLQGGIHLVNESDGWKVDRLDTSLLGVNLGALGTLGAFCAAMQAQNYSTAFGLFSSTPGVTADTFASAQQLPDQVDGKVTACAIKSIPSGNTDTTTTVTVTVTRATLGAGTGNVSLDGTGGAWKITKIDQIGTDVRPLLVGKQFCADIVASQWNDAYSLLSSTTQGQVTVAQLQDDFTVPGVQITSCTADVTSSGYHISGDTATLKATLTLTQTSNGAVVKLIMTLTFRQEGALWKVGGWKFSAS